MKISGISRKPIKIAHFQSRASAYPISSDLHWGVIVYVKFAPNKPMYELLRLLFITLNDKTQNWTFRLITILIIIY